MNWHADGRTWVIYETGHGFRLYVALEDEAISRNIIMGRYELSETEFVKAELKPGGVVVDVGANIGYYALLCSLLVAPHGHVYAFEPVPFLYDALRRSVAENRLEAVCSTFRLGLGAEPGRARFRYAAETNNFGGAFRVDADAPDEAGAIDDDAEIDTLDRRFPWSERCAFIKLDVEGAEPFVLAGATKTITRDRPVVLCELHNPQLHKVAGSSADELIATFAHLGYRCLTLDDGARGTPLTSYTAPEPLNVIFEPRPDA